MTTKKKDFDPVKFREEKYSEITNKMVEAIKQYLSGEKENLPWVKPWKTFGKFRNPVTGTKYSGMNIFILAMENYDDPRWVTWKNAKKLGGNVKEGEVPTTIVHYSLIKRKRDKENDNGEKFEEAYYFRVPTFKNVYNVTQCENLELEPLINEDEAPSKFEENEVAAKIINNYLENGPSLEIGGDKAFYSPLKDQIGMPDMKYFHDPEGYYTTLFHEMVHSTGHSSRNNRKFGSIFGSQDYAYEELVAEMGASFLAYDSNIDSTIQHESYIKSWLKELLNDTKLIVKAAAESSKACDYILNKYNSQKEDKAA